VAPKTLGNTVVDACCSKLSELYNITNLIFEGYEFLTAVGMKKSVFWALIASRYENLMFRRNISPPSSGSNSGQPAETESNLGLLFNPEDESDLFF
jgi:hypothetical protein